MGETHQALSTASITGQQTLLIFRDLATSVELTSEVIEHKADCHRLYRITMIGFFCESFSHHFKTSIFFVIIKETCSMYKSWKLKINQNFKMKIFYTHTSHINLLIGQYITSQ